MRQGGAFQTVYWSCPKCDWDEPVDSETTLDLPAGEFEYLYSSIEDIAFLRRALTAMIQSQPRLKLPRRITPGWNYSTLRVPRGFVLAYEDGDAWIDAAAPFEILTLSAGKILWELL